MTDQDLKELGVSLGHRRKMLRAIAELSGVAWRASRRPTAAVLSSVAFWATNYIAFDGTLVTKLASEFFVPAEEKGGAVHLIGHRVLGISLLFTGDIVQSRTHFNQALALYDPAKHRRLAMRFGHDNGVAVYTMRSLALWILGFPDAALADAHQALKDARDIGQAATLMYALSVTLFATFLCGRYTTVEMQSHEVASVADDKGAPLWKAYGTMFQGLLSSKSQNVLRLVAISVKQ